MSSMIVVFLILGITIVLFVVDRIRLDIVALLALLALLLSGILTVTEALAGFSATVVIIIAALFIVGLGLLQTGVAAMLGRLLARLAGNSEMRILALVMGIVALLSAFMSSTGAVAMLLPAVISVARDIKISPAKLAMPLAFGSLIGGMLTLIGTPPNLVVSDALQAAGEAPFSFFAFTPIGLVILVVGLLFMALIGRHLLPNKVPRGAAGQIGSVLPTIDEMAAHYQLPQNLFRLRIRRNSPLVGLSCMQARLGERYHVDVIQVQSWPDGAGHPKPPRPVAPDTIFERHDILYVHGAQEAVTRLSREESLGIRPNNENGGQILPGEIGLAEVLISTDSQLIGRTLAEARFRNRYDATVVAVMRNQTLLHEDVAQLPLRLGDMLLVEGTWRNLELLEAERSDFIVIGQPRQMEEQLYSVRYATTAIAIVIGMLVLASFNIVPTVTATLLAAVAMVLSGCVRVDQMYSGISWESIILIAAMLPMATALEKTGGIQFVATALTDLVGGYGPLALMAGLYLITTFFSQFMSNTATAVLIAPLAVQAAQTLGWELQPFLMVVAIAASTSFSTPIASPVNTIVMGPGGYRFMDFVKVGVPLQIVVLLVSLLVIPWFFPV
jgi:di/tricarboxylate transporter